MNSAAPPFDNPQIRKAMALALDRKAFIDILTEGKAKIGAAMLPAPGGPVGACRRRSWPSCRATAADIAGNLAEAQKIMAGLGYGPGKPLKVKVSVSEHRRSIATPR